MTMRVLVCGDRNWKDDVPIWAALCQLSKDSTVIVGCCRGADYLGFETAKALRLSIEKYPPDWEKHGKAAGPIRNQRMLDEGKPDLVLAFHPDIENSKGTKDMVSRAKKAGVTVKIIAG
jgi:hypothetical protein